MTSRCRISVRADEYVVHVLMREVERGSLNNDPEAIQGICARFSASSITQILSWT